MHRMHSSFLSPKSIGGIIIKKKKKKKKIIIVPNLIDQIRKSLSSYGLVLAGNFSTFAEWKLGHLDILYVISFYKYSTF